MTSRNVIRHAHWALSVLAAGAGMSSLPSAVRAAVSVTVESYTPGTLAGGLNTTAYKTATDAKLQDFPLDTGGSASAKYAIGLRNGPFSSNTLVAIGTGGGITLKFQSPLSPLAGQKEFGIFTAQWLSTGGGPFNGNMQAAILVSSDNLTWHTLDGQVVADPLAYTASPAGLNAPTVSYQYGTTKNAYDYGASTPVTTLSALSPSLYGTPIVDDTLFNDPSSTNAQRAALITDTSPVTYAAIFGASAGGNWFDISNAGLADVQYVRINAAAISSAIRLDALFANDAAVPEPGTVGLIACAGTALLSLRRRRAGTIAAAAVVAAALLPTRRANAAPTFDDIKLWAGSGSNEAALVIDWNDGKSDESLLWGYRWDGAATGEDMLRAVIAADPNLYASLSWPTAYGTAVFGLGYDATGGNDFAVTPVMTFSGHIHVSTAYGQDDGFSPANSLDHYQAGWYSGYWSYWVKSDAAADWGYSSTGMTGRALVDGAWDGWSYSDFSIGSGGVPQDPVAARPVPEPAAFGAMAIAGVTLSLRRRRRLATTTALTAGATLLATAGAPARAAYVYNPNDFAVEVVSSTGFPASPTSTQYYSYPSAILGRPSLQFKDIFGSNPSAFHRVKLIEPAYATGPNNEPLITTFNANQSVTVRMGRTVYNDPANPYGIDLIVYGNSFFVAGGGAFVGDTTNLNTTNVGGVFSENVRVSVSPDNVHWYSFPTDAAHTGDGYYPTNSYLWDRTSASWTDVEADPTKPVDPSIGTTSLSGKSAADVLDLYDGAAGGTGFDLAESGFSYINYVRFDGLTGYSGGEIDAVAAVTPLPEPAAVGLLAVGGATLLRRRARRS